jgi:hypothetical protein
VQGNVATVELPELLKVNDDAQIAVCCTVFVKVDFMMG